MQEQRYTIRPAAVVRSLETLQALKIHRNFAGYLCLREAAARAGHSENLRPDFQQFFQRYLLVEEAPAAAPYVVPFNDRGSDVWFNRNVAGSYAPSSLRSTSPIRQVADDFGSGSNRTLSLKPNHAELCRQHLLNGKRIPALDVATFLLRDYAFISEAPESPSTRDVIDMFSLRFGFPALTGEDGNAFTSIFEHPESSANEIEFDRIDQ